MSMSMSMKAVCLYADPRSSLATNQNEVAKLTWMNATPVGSPDEAEGS
jgi:hypothetical protein